MMLLSGWKHFTECSQKKALWAYIRHRAYNDKLAITSILRDWGYLYVLQQKADHHAYNTSLAFFRWVGHLNVANSLPKNNHLTWRVQTQEKEVVHRKGPWLFMPQERSLDEQSESQDWKPDPDVIVEHDDLYSSSVEIAMSSNTNIIKR